MENKKLVTYLIVIGVGIILGIIASIINNYIWYIILFSYALGVAGGKIYDIVLIKNNFSSNDKKYINGGIIIFIITTLFSINTFDYYQNKEFFNDSFSKEYNNILNESIVMVNSLNEKMKTFPDPENLGNIISDTDKAIKSKEYKKAVDFEIMFLNKIEEKNGKIEEFSGIYENLNILKENFSFNINDDNYNTFLKESTGYDGLIGNWIFSIFNSGTVKTNSNKEVNTGIIGSIVIYIIDIIALWYGMIYTLSILKMTMCKIHNKLFKSFGETYNFPTTLDKFKGLELDAILDKVNTIPEKKGFFSMTKTYYCNISFSKCEDCNLGNIDTNIDIIINHYGTSKSKPLTGTSSKSFNISVEKYNSIIEKFKTMNLNNV
ncbi:MAG: hypothetical protein WC850_06700 [Candidatus Gracilibacteria bacterium]